MCVCVYIIIYKFHILLYYQLVVFNITVSTIVSFNKVLLFVNVTVSTIESLTNIIIVFIDTPSDTVPLSPRILIN